MQVPPAPTFTLSASLCSPAIVVVHDRRQQWTPALHVRISIRLGGCIRLQPNARHAAREYPPPWVDSTLAKTCSSQPEGAKSTSKAPDDARSHGYSPIFP
ncbi:hypothetical protein PMIN06_009821 [Paraphaeosphaeria minitans]